MDETTLETQIRDAELRKTIAETKLLEQTLNNMSAPWWMRTQTWIALLGWFVAAGSLTHQIWATSNARDQALVDRDAARVELMKIQTEQIATEHTLKQITTDLVTQEASIERALLRTAGRSSSLFSMAKLALSELDTLLDRSSELLDSADTDISTDLSNDLLLADVMHTRARDLALDAELLAKLWDEVNSASGHVKLEVNGEPPSDEEIAELLESVVVSRSRIQELNRRAGN